MSQCERAGARATRGTGGVGRWAGTAWHGTGMAPRPRRHAPASSRSGSLQNTSAPVATGKNNNNNFKKLILHKSRELRRLTAAGSILRPRPWAVLRHRYLVLDLQCFSHEMQKPAAGVHGHHSPARSAKLWGTNPGCGESLHAGEGSKRPALSPLEIAFQIERSL